MSSVSQGDDGSTAQHHAPAGDCPASTAFGFCAPAHQFYRMSDWEFMEGWRRAVRVPNTDAYEGTLFLYAELATDAHNARQISAGQHLMPRPRRVLRDRTAGSCRADAGKRIAHNKVPETSPKRRFGPVPRARPGSAIGQRPVRRRVASRPTCSGGGRSR
jgi:hypothetical protein